MKTKLLIVLFIVFKMFYTSYTFGQEGQKQDSISKTSNIFQMDMSDTLNIDTTQVVDVKYAQESQEAKFEVKFRGFVKLNMFYDLQGMKNTAGFNPYDIVQDSALNQSLQGYYIGARQSRIGFESKIKTPLGLVETYIEGDFAGDETGIAFRLRHAYGKIQYWTLGQTWSTFTDLEAIPNTVDRDGPNSATFVRQGLIRYERKVGKYELGASIESPLKDFRNPYDTADLDLQRDADLIGRAKYRHKRGHIQLAGISRLISFTDFKGVKQTSLGGGGMLSGVYRPGNKNKFLFEGIMGKGISRYIGGLEFKGEDAYPDENGSMELLPVLAVTLAYEYKWNEKFNSTLIYGFTKVYNIATQPENAFHQSQYFSINTFLDLLSNLQFGLEASGGDRTNKNDHSVAALRIQFMARFSF